MAAYPKQIRFYLAKMSLVGLLVGFLEKIFIFQMNYSFFNISFDVKKLSFFISLNSFAVNSIIISLDFQN